MIDHKHGRNVYTFGDEESAIAELVDYASKWWVHELGARPMPETPNEITRDYFDDTADWWSLEQCKLIGARWIASPSP